LGATALLLLPLTQIASARNALSLPWRQHVAERYKAKSRSANDLTPYYVVVVVNESEGSGGRWGKAFAARHGNVQRCRGVS
jgi:hypothetical protein